MLILLILSLILLAAVLYAQYRRSRALRRAARDLKEARMVPGTRLRLYSPDGKLEELLSQINGLLEDKERETRVLRSREESLRRQIANVSHDLRTPLTSISGNAGVLMSDGGSLTAEHRNRIYRDIYESQTKDGGDFDRPQN